MSGKAGIPPEAMLEILNNGTGRNFATMHIFPEAVLPRSFDYGFASVTTPLPATLPLFAGGLVGLGLLGWRRKRKAQAVV